MQTVQEIAKGIVAREGGYVTIPPIPVVPRNTVLPLPRCNACGVM